MEEYLQNIDTAIAFEDILKENELATIENLVEKCKFLESAETLEKIELPFPWKSPTKERSTPPVTESDPASTTRNEKLEKAGHAEHISHDESPTTNGGDDQTTISPSSIIPIGHYERPATTPMTERVETAVQTEQIPHDDSPTTNDGDDKITISPSQIIHTGHHERPAPPPPTEKVETSVQTEQLSPVE